MLLPPRSDKLRPANQRESLPNSSSSPFPAFFFRHAGAVATHARSFFVVVRSCANSSVAFQKEAEGERKPERPDVLWEPALCAVGWQPLAPLAPLARPCLGPRGGRGPARAGICQGPPRDRQAGKKVQSNCLDRVGGASEHRQSAAGVTAASGRPLPPPFPQGSGLAERRGGRPVGPFPRGNGVEPCIETLWQTCPGEAGCRGFSLDPKCSCGRPLGR